MKVRRPSLKSVAICLPARRMASLGMPPSSSRSEIPFSVDRLGEYDGVERCRLRVGLSCRSVEALARLVG